MSEGFIRLRRSPILRDLMLDANAWKLLGIIAERARWNEGPNEHNLNIGEALVGDYKEMKFKRQPYRDALDRLRDKWHQITTHAKSRGTIARLTDSAVFDLSTPLRHHADTTPVPSKEPPVLIGETSKKEPPKEPTENQWRTNGEPLTNKDIRKEGNNDDGKTRDNSLTGKQPSEPSSWNSVSSIEEAQKHPLWKEFCRYCESKGGKPTIKGFNTWLKSQPKVKSTKRSTIKMTYPKRETREPSNEEFARVGKIAREAMAEFKSKHGYG